MMGLGESTVWKKRVHRVRCYRAQAVRGGTARERAASLQHRVLNGRESRIWTGGRSDVGFSDYDIGTLSTQEMITFKFKSEIEKDTINDLL